MQFVYSHAMACSICLRRMRWSNLNVRLNFQYVYVLLMLDDKILD